MAQPTKPSPLTPLQAVRQAFHTHPALQSARLRIQGWEAQTRGAGALPNPQLRLAAGAGNPAEEANSLFQRFELGGQPGLRRTLALLRTEQARQRLQNEQRELALKVLDAYYSLWSTRQTQETNEKRLELALDLQHVAERRFRTGAAPEREWLRTAQETTRVQADLVRARADTRVASNTLNSLLQAPLETEVVLPTLLSAVPSAPSPDLPVLDPSALLQRSRQRSDLKTAGLEVQTAQTEAELATRERRPNLDLELYRSQFGTITQQGAWIALQMPLWDWGQLSASVEQKKRETQALQLDLERRQQEVALEVQSTRELCAAAGERRQILEQTVLNSLRQAELARKGFDAGYLTLLEVLDAQRTYRDSLLEYIEAETTYQKTRWKLHWLSGGSLEEETAS